MITECPVAETQVVELLFEAQMTQTVLLCSLLSLHISVFLLHLCPVYALKAMLPGLHTLVMDGMKYITAPRGALHQHNSPKLTSSAAL